MKKGSTKRGRSRSERLRASEPSARPLFRTLDHGRPVAIESKLIDAGGDRWVEAFLKVNRPQFDRLSLRPEVRSERGSRVLLHPGPRIGAIPLLGPNTHRVVAGLLVEPRFQWAALGAVFGDIGFTVEPALGGAPMVPGSAREVPPWILAAPVLRRIARLLRAHRRGFLLERDTRSSPRGRVDWAAWASRQLPHGAWGAFPCEFTEPGQDPHLYAALRWTLKRLSDELNTVSWSPAAHHLLSRARLLSTEVGPGPCSRPPAGWSLPAASAVVSAGVEAMSWVAEERGLGGSRILDGLTWDLAIDQVWEAWVASFATDLGVRLGLATTPFGTARRALRWAGPIDSMGSLRPDIEMRGPTRTVWIDAKYKRHLHLLARRGWRGMRADIRETHRADLHQALAYAALAGTDRVDTVLAYPAPADDDRVLVTAATLATGSRRTRLVLAGLPFAFRTADQRERTLRVWRELLAA